MGISTTGIGSGLQVESIVSQLVALEKKPLTALQTQAATIQSRISTYSQIKSLVSTFSDAAAKLTRDSTWGALSATSTQPTAVTPSITGLASASAFGMEVQKLARSQSTSSTAVTQDTAIGSGTLNIQLGTWNSDMTAFDSGSNPTVSVSITAGADTLTSIASKINEADAGVVATVLRDTTGERLLVQSKATGETSGFRIQVSDDDGGDGDSTGLSSLAFDPATGVFGMADNTYQKAQNTEATINGITVTSATNTIKDAVPGVQLLVSQVTTSPVTVTIAPDTASVKKNLQDFVAAYNALNDALSSATKYDPDTKTAGVLQGDSTTLGLQNMFRSVMGSSAVAGAFSTLSEIGIQTLRGGNLSLDTSKLDKALLSANDVKALFATDNSNAQTNGLAVKLKSITTDMLAFSGSLNNKADALSDSAKRNTSEQDKVNARAAVVEARLRKQYSALDTKMGSLTALNSYISQQVSQWNKSSG